MRGVSDANGVIKILEERLTEADAKNWRLRQILAEVRARIIATALENDCLRPVDGHTCLGSGIADPCGICRIVNLAAGLDRPEAKP